MERLASSDRTSKVAGFVVQHGWPLGSGPTNLGFAGPMVLSTIEAALVDAAGSSGVGMLSLCLARGIRSARGRDALSRSAQKAAVPPAISEHFPSIRKTRVSMAEIQG